MPQQNSSLFSSQSNGSQLHRELNQQTEPEQSTNNIKNHLILPLHSHLHLFHSFESQGLDITPNCKVTDHSHRRLHHLSPLTCCQLESHYRQCKTASTEQLPMLWACLTKSLVHTFNGSKRRSKKSLPGFDYK